MSEKNERRRTRRRGRRPTPGGRIRPGRGIGSSRLWAALARAVDPSRLTLIVNTADDLWVHGLRVCPDLDTTLYALSGRQDLERGWGLRGESWRCMNADRKRVV